MPGRVRFLIAGGLIAVAALYLIISSTATTARYYKTISELQEMGDAALGRRVTVSGAVLGNSIHYDASIPRVTFTLVNLPADHREVEEAGGLATVLDRALADAQAPRLEVVQHDVRSDLLQDGAQAIVRGRLGADGRFEAEQVLLMCPSRYEEDVPLQAGEAS
jgi:cytochrome c-type biogenesis protein CcmE